MSLSPQNFGGNASQRNSSISPFRLWLISLQALLVVALTLLPSPVIGQISIEVDATVRRGIGGISQLDRNRFFNYHGTLNAPTGGNLGNLNRDVLGTADGLNTSPGRSSTDFDQSLSNGLPEDPLRPGFVDPNALRNELRTSYKERMTTGSRSESLRAQPNPLLIQSGRSANFWPAYMRTNQSTNQTSPHFPTVEAYADFLKIYLGEVVYGPNAYNPVSPDRFHIELVNEPDFHTTNDFTPTNLAEYHRDIARLVKQEFPEASIGGASLGRTDFIEAGEGNEPPGQFSRFNQFMEPLIQVAGADIDFYSVHPYERYTINANGTFGRDIAQSPGRVTQMIDLIQTVHQNEHGDRKPIAFTEYGAFNRINSGASFDDYPRDLQQWDLVRDIRDKMMVFLNRPDTILNATPFVAPRSFAPGQPTPAEQENVFWEQDAAGNWQETIIATLFRTLAPVQGQYVGVVGDDTNVQHVAFRDGNKVYLILNNMLATAQALDLQLLAGSLGSVSSATIDRMLRTGGNNIFEDDVDITNTFQNLVLNGEEGAVVTFTLDNADELLTEINEHTIYGDLSRLALDQPVGQSPIIDFDLDGQITLEDAVAAIVRVGFTRPSNSPEQFDVIVNGNRVTVAAGGQGIDDGDLAWFSREVDVPLNFLVAGNNEIEVDFTGNGGFLSTAALVVTTQTSPVPEPGSLSLLGIFALLFVNHRGHKV